MKNLLLTLLLISCASTSKVRIGLVEGSKQSYEAKHRELKSQGCEYMSKVEVTAVTGPANLDERLMTSLTDRAEKVGGNTMITAMKVHGKSEKTKALMYRCPVKQ